MQGKTKRILAAVLAVVMFLAGVVLIFMGLTDMAQAQGATLSAEQRRAAEVAKGEAPIALLGGPQGYWGVLCTMQARLDSPAYPNTLDGVLTAYYGHPRPLTAQEEAIAEDVFLYGGTCGGGPYYYAFSIQDVERTGFVDGDWVTDPVTLPSGRQLGLHFYRAWPATKGAN